MAKLFANSSTRGLATPLASIFGSGFLVIVSVLGSTVGGYAVVAMAAVCLLACAVGAVIRYNIEYAEPIIENGSAKPKTLYLERAADFALVPAYVISVTLHLRILSSYALNIFNVDNEYNEMILTSGVIVRDHSLSGGSVRHTNAYPRLSQLTDYLHRGLFFICCRSNTAITFFTATWHIR